MVERLLSFAAADGSGYGAVAIGAGDAAAAMLTGSEERASIDDGSAARGEGSLRIEGGGSSLVLGVSGQTSQLGFEAAGGQRVSVQAIGVSAEADGGYELEGRGVAWSLEGGGEASVLRTAWAGLADGSLFVLFATRPQGATDHAAESVGAARIGRDGEVAGYAEPLLSTEYDGEGQHTRAALELWGPEAVSLPDRGAGLRTGGGTAKLGEVALAGAAFAWKLGGVGGIGGYEIVTA